MPTLVSEAPGRKPATRYLSSVAAGSAAEDERVRRHLPLVRAVVGRIAMTLPSHVDPDDLFSAGLVGLLNAVRNYNPDGGSSFEAYARVRIRGAVLDELRRLDWIPRSVHDKARKVQAVMAELEQQNGAPPGDAEIAAALNLSLADYEGLLDEIRPATFVCLDSAAGGELEEGSRYESIPDESQPDPSDQADRREMAARILDRLQRLPDVQRKVLALYYFEGLRLREIAEAFHVTESRICQIHSQAILAIRALLDRSGTQ